MNTSIVPQEHLNTVYVYIQDVAATLDLPTVTERLAVHTRDLLHADYVLVYLLAESEPPEQLVEVAGAAADWDVAHYIGTLLCFEDDLLGTVIHSGVGQRVAHTSSTARLLQLPDVPSAPTALLCAPLIHATGVIGVVVAARLTDAPPFTSDELALLQCLASQVTTAVAHAQCYQRERESVAVLRQSLAERQEHDRLKDLVLQNVSHEFRAPLTIARGYIELLECELESLSPEQREAILIVARRLRMLSELVRDINTILHAKSPNIQYEPVDFAALVREAAGDFCRAADKAALGLDVVVEDEPVWVLGNAVQLWRVLDNLIGNALKFTLPGGRIDITLRQTGDRVCLAVADTGMGISPGQLAHIFERFYQGEGLDRWHPGDRGMGLGLTMVKEIVEAHGGQVQVESDLGKGSTFTVSLPVMQAAS
ncbi:MAG TPA: GAF domain-containing sensor histidine kinase [Anaerolineae bacterium]|nr:GAF domain-containing sensor histidine kinase [Anaerolineae bacterium]